MPLVVCRGCRADLGARERIGRRDTCPQCGVDLHSCRQCRFHDPRAYNECSEPQAERVLDKDRGNFCEYFACVDAAAGSGGGAAAGRAASATGNAREDLERLFRRR
jgi:hypothetical protein